MLFELLLSSSDPKEQSRCDRLSVIIFETTGGSETRDEKSMLDGRFTMRSAVDSELCICHPQKWEVAIQSLVGTSAGLLSNQTAYYVRTDGEGV